MNTLNDSKRKRTIGNKIKFMTINMKDKQLRLNLLLQLRILLMVSIPLSETMRENKPSCDCLTC